MTDFDPDAYLAEQKEFNPDDYLKANRRSWLGAAGEGVTNIPGSGARFVGSMAEPIIHPVQTAQSLYHLGKGVVGQLGIGPARLKQLIGEEADEQALSAVGQFLVDRYGGADAIKNTLATDPVGMAADVSMFLTGGGSAMARAPGIVGKVGEAASTAGRITDPLQAVGNVKKYAGRALGHTASEAAGSYLTHTGGRPLREAYGAGQVAKLDPARAQAFQQALRGGITAEDTVDAARSGIDGIKQQQGQAYRSGMLDISRDKTILDFRDIDAAINKNKNIGTYKGADLETPKVKDVRDRMVDKIDNWKQLGYFLGADEYHTVEGFDALKKSLGYIAAETERGTPASKVAWGIYNSVKDTITQQAPVYAKIMEGYSDAEKLIQETERELIGKNYKAVGTALRKLQSIMRNNVHTSYGERERLAEILVQNGATHLMEYLAGQALSSWTPRGFGKAVGSADLVYGIGQTLLGHPQVLAATLLTLPTMSPRLLGEAAYYAGRMSASPYIPGRRIGHGLFQTGRLGEIEDDPRYSRPPFKTAAPAATPPAAPPAPAATQYDGQGNPIQSRAGGGPVEAGEPYVVGEYGPETIVPEESGIVVPHGFAERAGALSNDPVIAELERQAAMRRLAMQPQARPVPQAQPPEQSVDLPPGRALVSSSGVVSDAEVARRARAQSTAPLGVIAPNLADFIGREDPRTATELQTPHPVSGKLPSLTDPRSAAAGADVMGLMAAAAPEIAGIRGVTAGLPSASRAAEATRGFLGNPDTHLFAGLFGGMTPTEAQGAPGVKLTREQRQQLELEKQRREQEDAAAKARREEDAAAQAALRHEDAAAQAQKRQEDAAAQAMADERKLKLDMERAQQEAEFKHEQEAKHAALPFRERYPEAAQALSTAGAGLAGAFPYGVRAWKQGAVNRFNRAWQDVANRADEALAKGNVEQAKVLAEQLSAFAKASKTQKSGGAGALTYAMAPSLPAEFSMIPEEVDLMSGSDEAKARAYHEFTDPIRMPAAVAQGATFAGIGGKLPVKTTMAPEAQSAGLVKAIRNMVRRKKPAPSP
jgi:hypothetical protein